MNLKLASFPAAIALTLLLAACGGDAPAPAASSSEASVAEVAPVADQATDLSASAEPSPAFEEMASSDVTPVEEAATSSEELQVAEADQASAAPAPAESAPASAQDASASALSAAQAAVPTNPNNTSPAGNWLKICDPPQASGQRACILRQVVVTANKQFLGSFLLRDDPSQESRLLAVAAVPLGVLLPFGVTWQIDGGKPIRVPYMLCDPQSCATQLVVNEAYIASLKKGTKLTLTAKNRKNEDLTININLAGFTGVYDGDAALTYDEFNKNTTGEGGLEKVLADHAEQARQKLESSSSAAQ